MNGNCSYLKEAPKGTTKGTTISNISTLSASTSLLEKASTTYNNQSFDSNNRSTLSPIKPYTPFIHLPFAHKIGHILKKILISIFLAPWWFYDKIFKFISGIFIYFFTLRFLKTKKGRLLLLLIVGASLLDFNLLSELAFNEIKNLATHKPYIANTSFVYFDSNPHDSLTSYQISELLNRVGEFNSSPPYVANDRRLVPALYLATVKKAIRSNNNELSKDFTMKFSWADWLDSTERFRFGKQFEKAHQNKPIQNCNDFSKSAGFPTNYLSAFLKRSNADNLQGCKDLSQSEIRKIPESYYPRFKITAPKYVPMTPHARILHGSSYTYYTMDPPKRLIYVDGMTYTNIIVKISNDQPILPPIFTDETCKNLKNGALNNFDSITGIFGDIVQTIDQDRYGIEYNGDNSRNFDRIVYDHSRININFNFEDEKLGFKLSRKDFENFDQLEDIQKHLKHFREIGSLDNLLYQHIVNEKSLHPNRIYPKYFHEPDIYDESRQIEGSHYDWRFYNIKEKFPEYKKISILSRLIRAWLRFTNNEDINTWLAHGTLLGHNFNRIMLPWDIDHDVQVSSAGMWKLAKYFNQSVIIDTTLDDEFSSGYGQYFLDIGSSFFDRDSPAKNNVIDARFIDIHTGMYIDITQVAETAHKDKVLNGGDSRVGSGMVEELKVALTQYNVTRNELLQNNDVFSCKHYHLYMMEDLTEFKRDTFMGEYCFVQSTEDLQLDREFRRRHVEMNFAGHTWRDDMQMWVDNKICTSNDRKGESCFKNSYATLMYKFTYPDGEKHPLTHRRAIYPDWEGVISSVH